MLSSSVILTAILLAVMVISICMAVEDKVLALTTSTLSGIAVLGILLGIFYFSPSTVQSIPNTIFVIFLIIAIYAVFNFFVIAEVHQEELNFSGLVLTLIPVGLLIAGAIVILVDYQRVSYYDSATSQIQTKKVDLLNYNEDLEKIGMAPEYASYLFGKAMNQVPNSEFYQINSIQIQKIDGVVHYVADLEFTGFWRWNETKTFPGYFKLNATSNTSKVEFVKHEYSYASSAYLGKNAERAIRKDVKEKYFVGEPTIEIDDEGKVFYTMTLANAINVQSGYELFGVYLLDAATGEGKVYKKDELPEWVDGGIAPDYAFYVAENYATWKEGRFNWSHKSQKALNSNGDFANMKPVLVNGQLHYMIEYSTYKNAGNNSMVGYILMNTRNGEFYVTETTNESLIDSSGAISQAEKEFIEKQFNAKNPMLYNLDGNLSWIVSLHDGDGLFQSFYVVAATNPSVAAGGKTIETAMKDFAKALSSNSSLLVDETKVEEQTVTITIAEKVYTQSDGYYYLYLQDDKGVMYEYVSETTPPQMFLPVGGQVKITFKFKGENAFNTIISFETNE